MEVVLVRREVTEERMEGGSEAGLAWWRERGGGGRLRVGWGDRRGRGSHWSHPDRRPRFL